MTYDKAPERIFTLDPQSAEFVIALGLGDKIVGTWGMYTADELKNVPEFADQLGKIKAYDDGKTWPPPVEVIASTKPDLVVTTYRLNMPGYLDATRLKDDLGIASFTFNSNCTGGTLRDFAPLFQDIKDLGTILNASAKAHELTMKMESQLAEAASMAGTGDRPTVWEYAGETPPYPVGGTGIPNAVIWLAGGVNSFEDLPVVYGETSWEQVVQRNPDVVWVQSDAGPGFVQAADGIKKAVKKNPGLASVTGVKDERYVMVPYTTGGTLSVHNAEAVLDFAKQLASLKS